MIPSTREELKQRVLEELGEPVIKVNIANVQLENSIDDALDYWSEFHVDGQDHSYIKVLITQEHLDNNTVPMPPSVMAVLSIADPHAVATKDWMSGEYELMRDVVFSLSGTSANCSTANNFIDSTPGASYVIASQYIETLKTTFKPAIMFDYRYHKGGISFAQSLSTLYKPGDYMLLEVQGYLYKNSYNVWGDRSLRKLAAAYAKKQWGLNLKKFSGVNLPSGITLNGDAIYSDALQDIQEAHEYIQGQQEPLGIIYGAL